MASADLRELVAVLAAAVRHQLVCSGCQNGPGVIVADGELDECPACHGEHPNVHLIARIDDTLARIVEPDDGDLDDDSYPPPCTSPDGIHDWPNVEEHERCLCTWCGADGDA